MTYDEIGLAVRVSDLLGTGGPGDRLTTADIGLLDQYHAGGLKAVDEVIASLGLRPGDSVLDVGSGFGGPARRVAEATGAAVLGVDITGAYVDVAEILTVRTGLDHLVSFQQADVRTLKGTATFDAAITMHVQMNVADKAEWFAAIAEVMTPGGRLAIWEVCLHEADREPTWPMPWSLDGSDSFLVTADELLGAITSSGLEAVDWLDQTAWVLQWASTLNVTRPPGGLVLPMLLEDGFARVLNLGGALSNGTLRVIRGLFVKPAS